MCNGEIDLKCFRMLLQLKLPGCPYLIVPSKISESVANLLDKIFFLKQDTLSYLFTVMQIN